MAARNLAKAPWVQALSRWAYNQAGFNQLGLMRDDTLYESTEVKEALRRLPPAVVDERQFRLSRALQLSNLKTILPKGEWTKYEDDIQYLQPYLQEVRKENAEKKAWAQK